MIFLLSVRIEKMVIRKDILDRIQKENMSIQKLKI